MDEIDQEKMSFITSKGLFCYKMMPFGLKNVGATYQRLMNRMFHDQIGKNVEVYIDDMLVKSKEEDDHLKNLEETFKTFCKFQVSVLSVSLPINFLVLWSRREVSKPTQTRSKTSWKCNHQEISKRHKD
jgi:hypothetical protein